MLIASDDEIYRVDAVWLGPENFRFPWRATYRAYGLFVVCAALIQALERLLHIPVGVWSIAFGVLAAVWITRLMGSMLDHDRPLRAILVEFRAELRAPREDTRATRLLWRRRRRQSLLTRTYGTDTADPDESPDAQAKSEAAEDASARQWWNRWRRPRTSAVDRGHALPANTDTATGEKSAGEDATGEVVDLAHAPTRQLPHPGRNRGAQ